MPRIVLQDVTDLISVLEDHQGSFGNRHVFYVKPPQFKAMGVKLRADALANDTNLSP